MVNSFRVSESESYDTLQPLWPQKRPDPDGLIITGTKMTNTGNFLRNGSSKTQFFTNNVRSEKKNTKHSSVLLLRLVFFFSERTLNHKVFYFLLFSIL